MKLIGSSAPLSGGEEEGGQSRGCACAVLAAHARAARGCDGGHRRHVQSPLGASDPRVWGKETPGCSPSSLPCSDRGRAGGRGQGSPRGAGFRPGWASGRRWGSGSTSLAGARALGAQRVPAGPSGVGRVAAPVRDG